MVAGTYKIQNKSNGKAYYGSTIGLFARKCQHFKELATNKHKNVYLQRAYNLNPNEFEFIVLKECETGEIALQEEQKLIDQFWDGQNNCYNISKDAYAVMTGRNHTADVRKDISEKGIVWSTSNDYKNPSEGKFGKLNGRSKPICQYDQSGNLVAEFESSRDAARKLFEKQTIDSTASRISKCCRGLIPSANMFVWRFKGDTFDKFDSSNARFDGIWGKPDRYPMHLAKPVVKLDLQDNLIEEYDSCKEAYKKNNLSKRIIARMLDGSAYPNSKRPYKFAYKEDYGKKI